MTKEWRVWFYDCYVGPSTMFKDGSFRGNEAHYLAHNHEEVTKASYGDALYIVTDNFGLVGPYFVTGVEPSANFPDKYAYVWFSKLEPAGVVEEWELPLHRVREAMKELLRVTRNLTL